MSLWVIKIGTSLLRGYEKHSTAEVINNYSTCIAESKNKGNKIILVTSGAVGLGCNRLGIKSRPKKLSQLQAAAAIGQGHLMSLYEKAMGEHGFNVAQVLLTRSDLQSKNTYMNASMTLKQLLDWGVLPIINENDTISSEELKYGDNDTLSALVATSVGAEQLILLTDVDRLYSADPKKDSMAVPITDVHHLSELDKFDKESKSINNWGTGGIKTKLEAARIATASGIMVHLTDGRDPKMLGKVLEGNRGGTVFHPSPQPIENRKNWLAHAINPVGIIQVDNGAVQAIKNNGASLLEVGIELIKGKFNANEPVQITNSLGKEFARGISSKSSKDLKQALEAKGLLKKSSIVVHRDVLVLTL